MKSSAKKDNAKDLPPRWKKWDIVGKIILGLFGIAVTFFIQYQQWKLAKEMDKTTREFERSRLVISQGQLAGTLIENIIQGNEKEKRLALAILESTSKDMYPRIVEALAVEAPDKSTRKHAIQILGKQGDTESAKVLREIASGDVPIEERKAALTSQNLIKSRLLNNARAFYETKLFQSAAEEFYKLENLLSESEVDAAELALARVAFNMEDYKQAAEHYMKATKNIN